MEKTLSLTPAAALVAVVAALEAAEAAIPVYVLWLLSAEELSESAGRIALSVSLGPVEVVCSAVGSGCVSPPVDMIGSADTNSDMYGVLR